MAPDKRISSQAQDRARSLRRELTAPERRLWKALRDRRLGGLKFRRQVPIGSYFADFLCVEALLVVEVDGETHAHSENYDTQRTAFLASEGFRVVRFSNSEVMSNLDGVLAHLLSVALQPSPSQAFGLGPSLSRGERGE